MNKLNTHYYDGKLENTINNYKYEMIHCEDPNNESKILFAMNYLKEVCVQKGCSFKAKNSLNKIIQDRHNNIDHVNGLNAEILLYMIYTRIINSNNNEYFDLLNSQLDEMSNGMCPQGRCIRLLQILKAIDENTKLIR